MLTELSTPEGFPWMTCSPRKAHLFISSRSSEVHLGRQGLQVGTWSRGREGRARPGLGLGREVQGGEGEEGRPGNDA